MAMAALTLQSCYKDDEKIFSETSSARMENALNEARDVITSSENGWLLEMYPDAAREKGGYAYVLKFDKANVTAYTERKPGKSETSLWKVTNDDGPVLTFDTYNSIIHEFSTPSPTSYQASKGEFEFVIIKATKDVITLVGKKTGNKMYMYRMQESAESYIDKIKKFDHNFILSGMKAEVNGKQLVGVMDLDSRQVKYTLDGEAFASTSYSLTDNGIRLYDELEVEGKKFKDLSVTFNAEGAVDVFTAKESDLTMKAQFPDGWKAYDAYAGDYILTTAKGSGANPKMYEMPVTFTPAGDGSSFWVSGFNSHYDLKAVYNRSLGTVSFLTQLLYDKDHKNLARLEVSGKKYYLGLIPFAMPKGQTSGNVSYDLTYGITTEFIGDDDNFILKIKDNDRWSGKNINNMRVYMFTGTSMSSTTRATLSVAEWYIFENASMWYYPEKLEKVK